MMRRLLPLALAVALAAAGAAPAQGQYFRYGQNRIPPEQHRWQYLQSEHFDVYFYRGGEALARTAADHAEAALVRIEPLVGHRLEARVPILVYTGAGAFAATDAVPLPADVEGIGGVTERFKNRVVLPFLGDRREFARVLTHELVHAVLNDFFRSGSLVRLLRAGPRTELPLWMNEGLAEYAALGYDAASDRFVRAALLAGRLPDADRLRGYLAYKGGQSFWAFVAAEYGPERIAEILAAFRATRSADEAFGSATGLGLADLSARWHEALQDVTYPEVAFRERLAETARPIRLRGLDGGFVAAPAVAPQGDRIAFVAAGRGRLGVYVARLSDGAPLGRLLEARTSPALERLRLTPGALAWSPDGRRIAVAATAGRGDAVVIVDVATRITRELRIPGADAVLTVAWSPDGRSLAAEATRAGRSDLFVIDVRTGRAEPLTADAASDHAPAWSPDGASLVFHSDRGARPPRPELDAETGASPGGPPVRAPGRVPTDTLQFDLFRLHVATRRVERLTATDADETNAAFGADSSAVLYVSDANGVANLYALDTRTGAARPLTDLVVGLDGVSTTPDGERAVVTGLEGERPLLYLIRTPFERRIPGDTLAPTVFAPAARAGAVASPVATFASAGRAARNPFLRRGAPAAPDTSALASLDPLPGDSAFAFLPLDSAAVEALIDSLAAAEPPARPDARPARLRYGPESRTADGAYRARPYRLFFSADVVSGSAGYDALYGAQALAGIQASDVLGGHVFTLQSNLLLDLRNSDYLIGYSYRPRRADVSVQAFHLARLVPEGGLRDRLARYRQYGATAGASYPVTTFDRVDAAVSLLTVSQASVFDAAEPSVSRTLLNPVLSVTHDASAGGPFAPTRGGRVAASVSGSPAALRGAGARFATFLADARAYVPFGEGGLYSLALRASGAASVGPNPQRFYAAGVQGWLDPDVSEGGFPIRRPEDFAFATPVLPLRGYALGARSGAYFGLVNAEVRFPLAAVLAPRPFPILPLQGVAFIDAGALWGGPGGDRRLTLVTGGRGKPRRLDDLLVGGGFGARVLVFGFPVRFDAAFPFDGVRFRRVRPYLSVGADF